MNFIKSIFIWFFYVIMLVLLYPPAFLIWILTFWFDKRMWILHQYSCFWASTFTWITPWWRTTIKGREKIKPGKSYVLVSNHQSSVDIVLLYRLFVQFKWVAKKELFRVPIIGWNMTANRYIALQRGRKASILHMMIDSIRTLKDGSSVLVFPEGTRSMDTNIKSFKEGAFKLALETQTPIIPIVLDGTGGALPAKGFEFHGKQHFRLNILDEIPVESFLGKDIKTLSRDVQSLMAEELENMRKETK
ncbi:MAG: lysophospholipid acyltransferase family protein [Bacteroidales bacterium]|nr:lysophospholipid acyltransferase family protein [Bacteroidales bacterium]